MQYNKWTLLSDKLIPAQHACKKPFHVAEDSCNAMNDDV